MIKNRTHFALIAGIGFSLFSGLSHTTSTGEDDTALLITNPSAPARLGALALIHDDERFSVLRESGEIKVYASYAPPCRRLETATAACIGLYHVIPAGYDWYKRSYNPTLEAQNEEFYQQVHRDFNVCLSEHPPEEGMVGIPPECRAKFNRLKTVTDAMKLRVATRPIEEDTTQN